MTGMRIRIGLLFVAGIAALAGCANPGSGWRAREAYQALGHEPGWILTIQDRRLKFVTSSPETLIEIPTPLVDVSPLGRRYATERLVLEIGHRPCNDVRSGVAFSDHVVVVVGGYTYRGCGGKRVPLLDR